MEQSKQPKFTFSKDEQTQRRELKDNKLLRQYSSFREAGKKDLFYPTYHFYAPDGRINDPNGLCFWNGNYHIFYQQYPPVYPHQHWGHAISPDMVHWEDLPTAIYPDIENACFSGTTLVEDNRVIAMYHGWGIGNMVAISDDPLLLNWEKIPGNPVIPHLPNLPDNGLPYRVFDPYIWKEDDGYYSLSGTHTNGIMVEHLFFSQNLEKWSYLGRLTDNNPHIECGNDGACPYFLPFGENQHILFFFSHSNGSRCFIGNYDKITHKFTPKRNYKFSNDSVCVSSLVAPCAMSDGNGGVYVIYNIGDSVVGRKRRGMFSLMRHITPDEDGGMFVRPAEQNDSLRKELLYDAKDIELKAFGPEAVPARGKRIEISAEISMNTARACVLKVLCDTEKEKEYTAITLTSGMNRITPCGYVTVDTTRSSVDTDVIGRIPDSVKFPYDGKEKINVRIFVDNCIVEVFVNDRAAITQLAYSSLASSDGIQIEAIGGAATVNRIEIHNMDSIY